MCRDHPERNYLFFFVLAGHGIVLKGGQSMLLNEVRANGNFYRCWNVELDIRNIAAEYRNSYSVAIFACCREIYDPRVHSGFFKGTKADAEEYFKA